MEEVRVIDIEKIITSIADIVSAKIISDETGEIEEIHVISYNLRSPKQISRDIQSILMAKFEQKIDYKKISVAQINTESKIDKSFRFTIGAIGLCLIDNMVEIKVVLKKDGETYESSTTGLNTKQNIYRLVVQATLECIHNCLGRKDLFIVEDILPIKIAKRDAISIAITCLTKDDEGVLLGIAMLKKDNYEAIVKATLDAVNRKVYHYQN